MPLDLRLAFWTGALVNMGALVAFAIGGVRAIRRRDVASHRRRMLAAAALVGVFLASYALKVLLAGRESRAGWSAFDVTVLRAHETCVAVMLVAGAVALAQARRLGLRARFEPGFDAASRSAGMRLHRRAGWIALVAAAAGLATAALVLAGMYAR
jgi:uncharacterized membrane protein YozB (DUF420 family)